MDKLINIWHTSEGRVVSARELHEVLKIGRDFSTWIKTRINEYHLEEGVDFQIIQGETEFSTNSVKTVGRPKIEYALTVETAKELAMVERNDIGRRVRRQLIRIEEEYQQMLLNKNRVKSPKEIELELEKTKVAKLAELNKTAQETTDQVKKEIIVDLVIKECTGEFHSEIPKPISKRTTYRPKELVVLLKDRYGITISPYQIGVLSNQHNLKNTNFGEFVTTTDKKGKVIGSLFNYYESAVEELKRLVDIHGLPKVKK